MTSKEAAKAWGCSEPTVRKYIDAEYVNDLKHDENDKPIIPDHLWKPRLSKAKKATSITTNMLKAAESRQSINHKAFRLTAPELTAFLQVIVDGGLGTLNKDIVPGQKTLILTMAGQQYITAKAKEKYEIILALTKTVTQGAAAVAAFL